MTTIGIIGSGNIGSTLARLLTGAGHEVLLANSRAPETLTELVESIGGGTRAVTAERAADLGEVVVVTIPLHAYPEVPVAALAGKVVIDTMNYYPERDGAITELDDESTTTSELLAAHLPQARVVKMFNAIFFQHLGAQGRPPGSPDRRALPMAGDDPNAKVVVQDLVDEIGFDVVDAGDLAQGWRFQRDTAAYVVGFDVPALKEALDEATRYADVTPDETAELGRRSQEYLDTH